MNFVFIALGASYAVTEACDFNNSVRIFVNKWQLPVEISGLYLSMIFSTLWAFIESFRDGHLENTSIMKMEYFLESITVDGITNYYDSFPRNWLLPLQVMLYLIFWPPGLRLTLHTLSLMCERLNEFNHSPGIEFAVFK